MNIGHGSRCSIFSNLINFFKIFVTTYVFQYITQKAVGRKPFPFTSAVRLKKKQFIWDKKNILNENI